MTKLSEKTYIDGIKNYQGQFEKARIEMQELWLSHFPEVACEVIINVLGDVGWRTDIARGLIRDYYHEVYDVEVNGSFILEQLERQDYTYNAKEEVGWGEKAHFIHLLDKAKAIYNSPDGQEEV